MKLTLSIITLILTALIGAFAIAGVAGFIYAPVGILAGGAIIAKYVELKADREFNKRFSI